jgi:hypothetical protein
MEAQADLLQVVGASAAPRRLARALHGGQQQGDEQANDRDHHQELDKRKAHGGA